MAARKPRRVLKKQAGAVPATAPVTLFLPEASPPAAVAQAVWPGLVLPAVDLWKATLDNLLDSAAILQGIAEQAVVDTVDGSARCPNEIKQIVHETVGFLQRTRKDLRATLDRSHSLTTAWLDRMRGAEPDPSLEAGLLAN
jgi:hypothetical protein